MEEPTRAGTPRIDLRAPAPGTTVLVVVIVVAWLVGAWLGRRAGYADVLWGPRSEALRRFLGGSDLQRWSDEPWRLLSSGLVHVTAVHLVTNVVALLVVGRIVESLIGGRRAVGVAALGVIAGSIVATTAGLPRVDGASSAAFALIGAGIGVGSRWPVDDRDRRLLVPVFGLVALANLAASFVSPSLALSAHTGGLLLGLLVGAWLDPVRIGRGWLAFDVVAGVLALSGLVTAAVGG